MTAIDALLEQTFAELQRFVAAIAAERKTLISGDINQLPEIAEQKSALATRLSKLESQRDAKLIDAGFGSGRAGVDAWLDSKPAGSSLSTRDTWQRYMDLASEAKRENEINGKLINASLQQNQQAIATLLGDAAGATVYGADGQSKTHTGSRVLGRA